MKTQSNTVNFKNQVFYVGLDVHKRNWSVTIRSNNMHLKTFSMEPSPELLASHLRRNYPGGTYESAYESGFCGFWIHERLISQGIENIVVHAADVPTSNKEKVYKADKTDSKKLAKVLEDGSLNPVYVPSNWQQQIRSLCRLRERFVSHETRLKNRIKGFLAFYGVMLPENHEMKYWSRRFIKELESLCQDRGEPWRECLGLMLDELKDTRKRILDTTLSLRKHVSGSPEKDEVIGNLMTVPGIGFITAVTLYTEIIDIRRFKDIDHLASYVGLVPSCPSSGEKHPDGRLTPRRHKRLRFMLIEATWVAARKDPALLQAFLELNKRMKKSDAIIRIARKLLNRVRFVWLNKRPYKCLITQPQEK